MTTSYNGWPASPTPHAIDVVPLTVAGVSFVGGVRSGDVATVLGYVAEQFNAHVERLVDPGCWGWSYRKNRNANNLSCHSSGTAIDCNAPQHPNDKEATENYSGHQIDAIHRILASIPELAETVHWGGDWHRANGLTPDPMHFEIHDHDTAKLHRVAERIKAGDDMPYRDWPKADQKALADDVARAVWGHKINRRNAAGKKTGKLRVDATLTRLASAQAKQGQRILRTLRTVRKDK